VITSIAGLSAEIAGDAVTRAAPATTANVAPADIITLNVFIFLFPSLNLELLLFNVF
jgi:hypothetical protein